MQTDLQIIPIPAFEDNYIWLLHDGFNACVVDPGDAAPVIKMLASMQLTLSHILITHHHADHTGGVNALLNAYPNVQVFAPKNEHYAFKHIPVSEPDRVDLACFCKGESTIKFNVIDVPGHTMGHIAYYMQDILFCGDTLFSAGCGRLFEGTPTQMYHALQKLAQLPESTRVYCTHEYTLKNLQFASTIEPNNLALQERLSDVRALRQQHQPSLPSTIAIELATNPFLRCDLFVESTKARSEVELMQAKIYKFTEIRLKRNHY